MPIAVSDDQGDCTREPLNGRLTVPAAPCRFDPAEHGGTPMLNLREAAEQAGTSKSSIFRAIKSGRLSATRDDFGGVQIDPAELARAFPPKPSPPERAGT